MVWGGISLFGGFLENENCLENFILIFDWKWSISQFQFWRRILDIYSQPITAAPSFQDVDVIPEKYCFK